ncbi:hypothetical protein ACH4PU_33975 [Streptomyces sp. NPDC021100]|uniref:hypothetical protein n=1 Tax=Streptomyces sp. NPDC021100 TaxID=3365114 RepID=UPI0037A05720
MRGATPAVGMGVVADQPGNAAAFARRGLGRALELPASREEIAAAVVAVLGDPSQAAAMTAAGAAPADLLPLDSGAARQRVTCGAPARPLRGAGSGATSPGRPSCRRTEQESRTETEKTGRAGPPAAVVRCRSC